MKEERTKIEPKRKPCPWCGYRTTEVVCCSGHISGVCIECCTCYARGPIEKTAIAAVHSWNGNLKLTGGR